MTNGNQEIDTLHKAFDKYREFIEQTAVAKLTPSRTSSLLHVVARLSEEHPDESLDDLDFDRCARLIEHWKNRPVGRTGKQLSRSTCANFLNELFRFFRWLESSHVSSWELPRGFERLKRTVKRLPADSEKVQRVKVTLDQLQVLYEQAGPLDRLMICLALNCGLRPADMGRLTAAKVCLADDTSAVDHIPAGYAVLQIKSQRTNSHREYLLWPETLDLLLWAMKRADRLGQNRFFVTDSGSPMFNTKSLNPSGAMSSRFRRLVSRTRSTNPEFPLLTLLSVRRLGADLVRQIAGGVVASLFLGQRLPALFEHSAVPPFGQLHSALAEMRHHVAGIFER